MVSEADYATITSFGGRLGRQGALLRTSGTAPRSGASAAATPPRASSRSTSGGMTVRNRKLPPAERGDELRAEIRRLADELPGGAA